MAAADDEARSGTGADTGTGLPATLETAWGLRERPSKGPRPGLTLERIVDTAVALASAEGLAAVSMGRVAKELGVSTMSLYRYVKAKDELYILMQEAVAGEPPEPPPGGNWREGLARWARAQHEMYLRNLWLVRMPVSGPPVSPRSVEWMEYALTALDGTGLDEGEKLGVLTMLVGFVRNEATLMSDLDAARRADGREPDEVMRRYQRTLTALTDPERHPGIARLLASGVLLAQDEPGAEFEFGLTCVLDGVAALIEGR